ncbi:MAG: MBL fold metallo-hydrolase [Candidatus Omnitrophica bacterium]|nr:MBL fold metallo-hydrolase [Candidatus Omnitrophota bacterium]
MRCSRRSAAGRRHRGYLRGLTMSKISVTVLGTTAGVPTRTRAHSSLYVSYDDGEEECLLFDCGEGTQRQLMTAGLNMMKIDNIFITHWHGDHCLGLPGLVDTMGFEGRERPLDIFAPEAKRVGKCLSFSYSIGGYRVNPRFVPFRGRGVKRVLEKERFDVLSGAVEHSVPAVAYAIAEKDKETVDPEKARAAGLPPEGPVYGEIKEKGSVEYAGRRVFFGDISRLEKGKKLVFSGDTLICDNLRTLAAGADLLIQDCTYFGPVGRVRAYKHACLPEVLEMVSSIGVKRTVLTHISRRFGDPDKLRAMVEEYPGVEVAEDLMVVVI